MRPGFLKHSSFGGRDSGAAAWARNKKRSRGWEALLSSPQHARRLHSPVSPASILMVYFHVCLPHSTVNDFRTPPPLANLATPCKILRYPFLKTLACHLPDNCHNNKRNLDECEVMGAPWSCAVCSLSSNVASGGYCIPDSHRSLTHTV